jgi:hypothetical protein
VFAKYDAISTPLAAKSRTSAALQAAGSRISALLEVKSRISIIKAAQGTVEYLHYRQ